MPHARRAMPVGAEGAGEVLAGQILNVEVAPAVGVLDAEERAPRA